MTVEKAAALGSLSLNVWTRRKPQDSGGGFRGLDVVHGLLVPSVDAVSPQDRDGAGLEAGRGHTQVLQTRNARGCLVSVVILEFRQIGNLNAKKNLKT